MSWKDRTLEFAQIVDSMRQQKKMTKRPLLAHADGPTSSVPKSQFTVAASQLGRQIHDTAQKLANLTKRTLTRLIHLSLLPFSSFSIY